MKSSLPSRRPRRSNRFPNRTRIDRRPGLAGSTILLLFLCLTALAAVEVFGAFLGNEKTSSGPFGYLLGLIEEEWASAENPDLILAREYIYAGERLIAVEDAGARPPAPADLAVWRPKSGIWWVFGGTGDASFTQAWGASGDIPVAGDFDGDGKTDLSVFRPSEARWWILRSSDGQHFSVPLGTEGDFPAAADFDGDGKTDPAVFRSTDGWWTYFSSRSGATVSEAFGAPGDIPAPCDFDGDGVSDPGVWRPSSRIFLSLDSLSSEISSTQFGSASDEPVPADYDGDGLCDPAVRSGGDWVYKSTLRGRFESVSWRGASSVAVRNDYDGDGAVDVAVWEPESGTWYIRQSSDGATRTEVWGIAGDVPVPAFYRR